MQGLVRSILSLAEFHMEGSKSPAVESASVRCTGPTSCRAPLGAGGMRGRKGNQVPAGPGILISQPSPDKGQLVPILGVQGAPFGYFAALQKHQFLTG